MLDDAEITTGDLRTRVAANDVLAVAVMVAPATRIQLATGEVADVTVTVRSPNLTRTQLTATEDVAGPKHSYNKKGIWWCF